jgi:pyruvate dehydrogenase E1 component
VRTAAAVLAEEHGVAVEVFSATSYSELARDAARVERHNRLAAAASAAPSHLDRLLPGTAPVVAASDHVRAVPQQIAPWIRGRFTVLGTDGFGRSSDRAALRRFFEVDSAHVVVAGLEALARDGALPFATVAAAIRAAGIDAAAPPPWTV